jgi:hypothetical protein
MATALHFQRAAARLFIEAKGVGVVLAQYPTGRRPGLRLRPHCCQQRQGARVDEGLA